MNRRILPALRILSAALPIFLLGCSTAPQQLESGVTASDTGGNLYAGTKPVYAHLETGSGGSWLLGTITESDAPPADGYLVRLNDLAPAFDTRTAECEPQNYPANHKCNPSQPFRDKEVGVVGKIISGGIAAGTGGKITDISGTYVTSFDEPAFNKAVDEALTNTGLAEDRQLLLQLHEDYGTRAAEGRAELRRLNEELVEAHQSTASLDVGVSPTITGLREYYSGDIDFRELVDIVPIDEPGRALRLPDQEGVLPCEARLCLQSARERMADLERMLASEEAAIRAAQADPEARYRIACEAGRYAGYTLAVECPESVSRGQLADEPIPVSVTVLARDFDALYPDLRIGDEALEVDISEGIVRLSNLTNSYLTVTAQTLYYNSRIETITGTVDIAPGVTVEQPIQELASTAMAVESRYEGMTPDKAARTTFRFGYAARYQRGDGPTETTLHDLRTFNVGCVIQNRLRPGACQDPGRPERQAPESGSPAERGGLGGRGGSPTAKSWQATYNLRLLAASPAAGRRGCISFVFS